MKRFAAVLLCVVVAGCAEPTIDATNDETLDASIKRVAASVPKEQHKKMSMAMTLAAMPTITRAVTSKPTVQPKKSDYFKPMHGMTASQVMEWAEQRIAEKSKARRK